LAIEEHSKLKALVRKLPCQNYHVIPSLLQLKHIIGLWYESASSDRHYHPKFLPNVFTFCYMYCTDICTNIFRDT